MIGDMPGDESSENASDERPTRTERTRAATAVNRLGLELTSLSVTELDRLELPERVREAIDVCQKLKPRGRGRQNRLIGQLLRAEDHDAIRQRFEALKAGHRSGVLHEKATERWLERLVEEGDPGVEALMAEYLDADRQRLRLLTRNARTDRNEAKAKRARRELLRAIRELRS